MVKLRNRVFNFLAFLVVALALLVGGLRLGISNLGFVKTEIEFWLTKDIIPGVSFASFEGGWNQLNPILRLRNATITLPDRSQPLVVDNIELEFDLYLSLLHRTAVVREATGNIDIITIRRDVEQGWWLNDVNLLDAKNGNAGAEFDELIDFLPYYLRLNVRRLVIEDDSTLTRHQLKNIEIDIQHFSDTVQLKMVARLPREVGRTVEIRSILKKRDSLIYITTEGLRPDPLQDFINLDLDLLAETQLSSKLWLNITDNQLRAISGVVNIEGRLASGNPDTSSTQIELAAKFQGLQGNRPHDWIVISQVDELTVNNQPWNTFTAMLRTSLSEGELLLEASVDFFDLINLQALPTDNWSDWLKKSKPGGRLQDINVRLLANNPENISISANFQNLSLVAADNLPGIEKLEGSFVYADHKASIDVSGLNTQIDFREQFRAPFEVHKLDIEASANFHDNYIQLAVDSLNLSNKDINLDARLWLEIDADKSPFLFLRSNFNNGVGSSVSKYLPVKLLPAGLLSWLDRGIVDADVSNGQLLFHGRLNNIIDLDRHSAGELYVSFDLDNADIIFDPEWEKASKARGSAVFHNLSMEFDLESVRFGKIVNARARVGISNYMQALLELDIDATTRTATGLETWISLPVGRQYSAIVDKLRQARGWVDVKLDIDLPLTDDLEKKILVDLDFKDAAIKAPAWGLELSQINGAIQVTENEVSAEAIRALYFDDVISVDINTDTDDRKAVINAGGVIKSRQLLQQLPETLLREIDGSSYYDVDIFIPLHTQSGASEPVVRIEAKSNLRGSRIDLPEPFRKKRDTTAELSAQIDIFEEDIEFVATYAGNIRSKGRLNLAANDNYRLLALDLSFSSAIRDDLVSGIRVYGTTPYLALNNWVSLLESWPDPTPDSSPVELYLETLDLRIQSMFAFNRLLEDTDIFLIRAGNSFQGNIKSSMLKGEFSIPWQDSVQQPIVLDLEYLRLNSLAEDSRGSNLLPSQMRHLTLTSQQFEYDDIKLADLALSTRVSGEHLELDRLTVKRDKIILNGSANWTYNPDTGDHYSVMDLTLTGTQLGQAMAASGIGDVMHNGEVDLSAQLAWFSPLIDLDWDSLLGEATLDIRDGIIKDVDQGAGRFVGLLSLNALPRRLFLDFSDIIVDGLEFDEIKGTYRIEGENLITEDTIMDGSSASVKVVGVTGLRRRDYEQTMVITPKVRQTLPVIGSIAAGNAVGWGLLLLQNLFKKEIDKSVEIEYRISGGWDDPDILLVTDLKAAEERIKNDK